MKKFMLASAMVLMSVVAFSQNVITPMETGTKTYIDGISLPKTPIDTIMDDEFFIDQAVIYGYTGGGYVFGVNISNTTGNKKVAQGYINFNPTLVIEEVLLWVGGLYGVGANSDLVVTVNALDDSSSYGSSTVSYDIICPGTVMSTVTIPFANIDTTDFTVATLPTPINCPLDFAVVADYTDYYANSDTIGFVCSFDGGASASYGVEYTWWEYPASTPFWTQASHVFADMDNLIAFFPVVSHLTGLVENPEFVNGVKLGQNFPNPSVNGTTSISYALETASDVTLTIFDQQGRTVETINAGQQQAGTYTVELDTQLSAGTYYYSLAACGTRLTKKMIIQ